MEQHPVPQNVTSFEFHLIGDMTLKQFGYLAFGMITAYITFLAVFPIAPVIAVPFIAFSALSGAAFAFLPIYDRPLDHWLSAFFRAIYSPTQRSWHPGFKITSKNIVQEPLFKNRLQTYLTSMGLTQPPPAPSKAPMPPNPVPLQLRRLAPYQGTGLASQPAAQQPPQPPKPTSAPVQTPVAQPVEPSQLPSTQELDKLVEMAKQVQLLQIEIVETEKQISQIKSAAVSSASGASEYKERFQQAIVNLQNLIKQAEELSRQAAQISKAPVHHPNEVIKIVNPKKQPAPKLLLTSLPNVVNGVVSDSAGNYLEGVIVIIHDKDNLPVRALKTNKLGQFSGATPLPNGTYNIILEKENLAFDTLQTTLSGQIIPPLQIAAKKGGPAVG